LAVEPTHILVVDDDAEICDLLREYLIDLDFDVSVAIDAAHGREIINTREINLLISDQIMFGELGLQLADFAGSLGVPTILMSGDPKSYESLPGQKHAFIQKPFHLEDLAKLLHRVLACHTV